MYAIITHTILGEGRGYTFKFEGARKVGDLMVCKTRRGARLGKIVGFIDEADCSFIPTAVAVKLNAGRRRSLSAYDRARIIYAETEDANSALSEFNLYNPEERKEFLAFCYGILDAIRVEIFDNHTYVYFYNYKEDTEYVLDHVFF